MDRLSRLTGRALRLADEDEVADVFPDCSLGAVPAVGAPYGLECVVDDSIPRTPEAFLQGGDHATPRQVTAEEFPRMNRHARPGASKIGSAYCREGRSQSASKTERRE